MRIGMGASAQEVYVMTINGRIRRRKNSKKLCMCTTSSTMVDVYQGLFFLLGTKKFSFQILLCQKITDKGSLTRENI